MLFSYTFSGGISFRTELIYGKFTLDQAAVGVNDLSFNGIGRWSSPDRISNPGKANDSFAGLGIWNPFHQTYYVDRESSGPFSDFLKVTNFNSSTLEPYVRLEDVQVVGCEVYCQVFGLPPFSDNVNLVAHLVKNNAISEVGAVINNVPHTLQYIRFGSPHETWEDDWLPGDINDNFGVAFSAEFGDITSGGKFVGIAHAMIVLYFTALVPTNAIITFNNWSYTFAGGLKLDGNTDCSLSIREFDIEGNIRFLINQPHMYLN